MIPGFGPEVNKNLSTAVFPAEGRKELVMSRTRGVDDGCIVIFRPYITTRNGTRIYAAWFGKKAFPIRLKK